MTSEDTDDIGKRFLEDISRMEQKATGLTTEEKQKLKSLIEEIKKLWNE
jgi:hypothetical protein